MFIMKKVPTYVATTLYLPTYYTQFTQLTLFSLLHTSVIAKILLDKYNISVVVILEKKTILLILHSLRFKHLTDNFPTAYCYKTK